MIDTRRPLRTRRVAWLKIWCRWNLYQIGMPLDSSCLVAILFHSTKHTCGTPTNNFFYRVLGGAIKRCERVAFPPANMGEDHAGCSREWWRLGATIFLLKCAVSTSTLRCRAEIIVPVTRNGGTEWLIYQQGQEEATEERRRITRLAGRSSATRKSIICLRR